MLGGRGDTGPDRACANRARCVAKRRGLRWRPVRALIVTNLYPTPERPRLGPLRRDQVEAIGPRAPRSSCSPSRSAAGEYLPAARRLRRFLKEPSFDVVHAHYGLCGWVASLAGAGRWWSPSTAPTSATGSSARLAGCSRRRIDLIAGASRSTFEREGGRPRAARTRRGPTAVLPCGVDLDRFRPLPRAEARRRLGLEPDGRYPALPGRPRARG